MRQLFLISIGPVQELIAAARTSRDLAAGSRLLSAAVVQVARQLGLAPDDVIFPLQLKERLNEEASGQQVANLPNRFVCRIRKGFDSSRQVEMSLRDGLAKWISDRIAKEATSLVTAHDNFGKLFFTQIQEMLECHISVIADTDTDLAEQWKELNRLNGARKAVRDFGPYTGDHREKCTLCGRWEQMGRPTERGRTTKFWNELRSSEPWKHRIGEHERLCGVCFSKRFLAYGPEIAAIVSTEDVATGAWKRAVDQAIESGGTRLKQAKAGFLLALGECLRESSVGTDWEHCGEWLLERNLKEALVQRGGGRAECAAAVVDRRSDLFEAARSAALDQPLTNYYAVIHADGDAMGRILSLAAARGIHQLQSVSSKLSAFADQTQQLFGKYKKLGAACIYAGGDDVLALTPLAPMLSIIHELRRAYTLQAIPADADSFGTLSVGIAVAHVRYPLQLALQQARLAESRAKEHYDRNAFCIHIVKRSGETVQAGGKWQVGSGGEHEVIPILEELISHFRTGSVRWIYQFQQELPALSGLSESVEAIVSELGRLMSRRDEKISSQLGTRLQGLLQASLESAFHGPASPFTTERLNEVLSNFANLCHIAAFVARGGSDE